MRGGLTLRLAGPAPATSTSTAAALARRRSAGVGRATWLRRFDPVADVVVFRIVACELVGNRGFGLKVGVNRLQRFLPLLLAISGLFWFASPPVAVALPLTHRNRLEHKRRKLGNLAAV